MNWGEHVYYDPSSPSGLRVKKLHKVAGHLASNGYWVVRLKGV